MMKPIKSIASSDIKILIWQSNTQKQYVLTRIKIHGLYLPHGADQSPYIASNMMPTE